MLNNKPMTPILLKDLGRIYPTEKSKQKTRFGIYKCFCGNEFKTQMQSIKNKDTISCGCYVKILLKEKSIYSFRKHRLYSTWHCMVSRCTNKDNKYYKNYGARGIIICDRWLKIENFIEDMYPTYQEGLTLDRINNNGNYEPLNCRWATRSIQSRNTRILRSTNTSGYRGATFDKVLKKWKAQIRFTSKNTVIGYFNNAIDAAYAHDLFIKENNLEHTTNGLII